jgi:hypothetical protein
VKSEWSLILVAFVFSSEERNAEPRNHLSISELNYIINEKKWRTDIMRAGPRVPLIPIAKTA